MKNRLIAAVAAGAIALSSAIATPAAAMSEKDRRALTLLLGAAAVGLIINESNKKKRKSPATQTNPGYGRDIYRDDDWHRGHGSFAPALPQECVFAIRGNRGPRDVVSSRCLREAGVRRRLPQACAIEIDSSWGTRTVYGAHCLRQNGFSVARLR